MRQWNKQKEIAEKNNYLRYSTEKNNKKWKATMELNDWIKLYNEYYSSKKLEERGVTNGKCR